MLRVVGNSLLLYTSLQILADDYTGKRIFVTGCPRLVDIKEPRRRQGYVYLSLRPASIA